MIYIGIGSNLPSAEHGPPEAVVHAAIAAVVRTGAGLVRTSSLWRTAPVPPSGQPSFLNAVIEASTTFEPLQVLTIIQEIETGLGRVRIVKSGPRTLDIDILAWGDRVVSLPHLRIPHPSIKERRFVLEPLAEIHPNWRHPETGERVGDMLCRVQGQRVLPVLPD